MNKSAIKKLSYNILSFMLALILCFSMLPVEVRAASQEDIDELKKEIEELDEKKEGYNEELSALENDMSAALERKRILDSQITATLTQIEDIEQIVAIYESEIGTIEEDIANTERELAEARQTEQESYALYCQRVRALEETGNANYLLIIFGASSFSDLLTRIDFVSEVIKYNEDVIREYNAVCEEIAAGEVALRGQLAEKQDIINSHQEALDELDAKKEELEQKRTEANEIILSIYADQNEYQELIDEIDAQEDEVEAEITAIEKEIEEERKKKEAEEAARKAAATAKSSSSSSSGSTSSSSSATKGFIWPVSSRRITSYFGYRSASDTNGVGSTNHRGIDIGAVYYSTTVVASKAGTIKIATYSESYGNYVMIDHGDGSVTVYAHLSSIKVSKGQTVKQGQAIGITGSTGHSTGPHLHFEIRINGNYVNPLNYLP